MAKSVMVHQFSQVPRASIPRSSFNRSHGLKTTFDAGLLVPIYCDEALPGDTFNLKMTAFARMATPIHPIMDNMFMETFFFAVPIRLIWDNWKKFNGEQDNPGDSTDFTVPQTTIDKANNTVGSIHDYFGIPVNQTVTVNVLHHRAYNLIYNEWFRDQNLQNKLSESRTDGPDVATAYAVQRRGKRHDYFTSALPWPQKGPAVQLPLGTQAPIYADSGVGNITIKSNTVPDNAELDTSGTKLTFASPAVASPGQQLFADLTNAAAATINELRQSFQIQKMFERDARGGTRYTEIIRAHFSVVSPDQRLQRPEFLGGGSSYVNITPVAQTSQTVASPPSPQGNLAAYGTTSLNNHGFTRSFTEHCVIIGLVNVRADLTYQQGLNRMWSRRTRFDYYWPALSHIGEQTILNKEIYHQDGAGAAENDNVFGYQERYAEYRYKPSQITGKFRSAAPSSLHAWHLSQEFSSLPQLNNSFIIDQPPVDRVIAVNTEPHFIMDAHFNLRCARPMPVYGVPGRIDHF